MRKLIFFDVDGVLINSHNEIILSSWNEFNLWKQQLGLPASPFTVNINDIPDAFVQARTAFGKKSNKGYHRVAINPLILAGFDPNDISQELIQQLSEVNPKLKQQTMQRLKVVRDKLLATGSVKNLVSLYSEVDYDWIRQKMHNGELYFITNNIFSIQGLSATAFIPDDKFVRGPSGNVHDKSQHINAICQQHGTSPEACLFIDDSPASLLDVSDGTLLPNNHIVQNSWSDKPNASGFPSLNWQQITEAFENI